MPQVVESGIRNAGFTCRVLPSTVSIYRHMQQAAKFGTRFYACSDALDAHAVDRAKLVPELTGIAGAAAFLDRALDPEWATLVF